MEMVSIKLIDYCIIIIYIYVHLRGVGSIVTYVALAALLISGLAN